jgi:oxalate decarboxylase
MRLSRRDMLAATSTGGLVMTSSSTAQAQPAAPQPIRGGEGATVLGPRNAEIARENPDLLAPPRTDHGSVPNLKWPFSLSHNRLEDGGWARETTARELPASQSMAGVNMRLVAGGVRELHWHKASEWAYVLAGRARITAVDQLGRTFVDDVRKGDLWFFPPGIPHSIQGLDPDGTEFLLAFNDGDFSEDNTFLITDWLAHTPRAVLAKNFDWPESAFDDIPQQELYIFKAPVPGPLDQDRVPGAPPVPQSFSYRLLAQEPQHRSAGGTVRIADTSNFPISDTTAAALVEVEPGGMREMHWHPNADEWQYWIEGQGRMTVFASSANARTFDFQAGDVGFVPFAMGHYIENTGASTMRYLELFPSPRYEDVSLAQWMALTPHELVQAHLRLDPKLLDTLRKEKAPVVPA